jgi:hypothetical protein
LDQFGIIKNSTYFERLEGHELPFNGKTSYGKFFAPKNQENAI